MNISFEYGNTDPTNNISKCHHLLWPKKLERAEDYPFELLHFSKQPYYWPNRDYGPYNSPYKDVDISHSGYYGMYIYVIVCIWVSVYIVYCEYNNTHNNTPLSVCHIGIQPKNSEQNADLDLDPYHSRASAETPIFPYAAKGPMQYARPFIYQFNETYSATLLESCTSVFAEPTRETVVDGLFGRADGPIRIGQPRRQRPGWDGCRERADGRTELPRQLVFTKPLPRAQHQAVFFPDTSEIFMFGGMVNIEEQPVNYTHTYPAEARGMCVYWMYMGCVYRYIYMTLYNIYIYI